jgi:integrase
MSRRCRASQAILITPAHPGFLRNANAMSKLLTAAAIASLKPDPTRRREIHAGHGLYYVLQPSGKGSWAVRYRAPSGKSCKYTLGPARDIGLKEARELADETRAKIRKGGDPAAEKAEMKAKARTKPAVDDLVETVIDTFIRQYAMVRTRASSWGEAQRILQKELKPWFDRRLSSITRVEVQRLLDAIVARPAPAVARQLLLHFNKLCSWAMAPRRQIIASSPCVGAEAPKPGDGRNRILDAGELTAAWRAAGEIGFPFGPIVQLLILTGARKNEVAEMTWAEIDVERRVWTLPASRAKNGRKHGDHLIPLSDGAMAIIESLPRFEDGDFLFTHSSGRTPTRDFVVPKVKLGELIAKTQRDREAMQPWVLHDLRRSCASGLGQLKIQPHVIEAVLGHKSGAISGVARVYNRYSYEDEKRAALDRWSAHVEALVIGSPMPGAKVIALRA